MLIKLENYIFFLSLVKSIENYVVDENLNVQQYNIYMYIKKKKIFHKFIKTFHYFQK